jgi:hypothetical protein
VVAAAAVEEASTGAEDLTPEEEFQPDQALQVRSTTRHASQNPFPPLVASPSVFVV